MKKLLLIVLLNLFNQISAATVDVNVKIDGISKHTTFNCPTAPLKKNNQFACACEQFVLTAKIVETFEDGLTIEFEFVDKDQDIISRPIFRVVWNEPAQLTCEAADSVFFELTVTATK